MQERQIDLASDIYAFLRSWWGLKGSSLSDKKCELLARSVSKWRKCFRDGKYSTIRKMYRKDSELAGYLTAFGPRYAYTLYFLASAMCETSLRSAKKDRLSLSVTWAAGPPSI